MAKATRENRYPQGYLPKIMYWAEQLYNACEYNDGRDTDRIEKAKAKLDYFYTRQQRAIQIDKVIALSAEEKTSRRFEEIINSEQGTISDVPQDYIENEHSKYQKEITPELYNKHFHKETFNSVSTEV
jgi:hypothetical protein|tara:strand:+ start:210 stop:593 length:384 start_codon:yes stop_codon:yes gene_type:complete